MTGAGTLRVKHCGLDLSCPLRVFRGLHAQEKTRLRSEGTTRRTASTPPTPAGGPRIPSWRTFLPLRAFPPDGVLGAALLRPSSRERRAVFASGLPLPSKKRYKSEIYGHTLVITIDIFTVNTRLSDAIIFE